MLSRRSGECPMYNGHLSDLSPVLHPVPLLKRRATCMTDSHDRKGLLGDEDKLRCPTFRRPRSLGDKLCRVVCQQLCHLPRLPAPQVALRQHSQSPPRTNGKRKLDETGGDDKSGASNSSSRRVDQIKVVSDLRSAQSELQPGSPALSKRRKGADKVSSGPAATNPAAFAGHASGDGVSPESTRMPGESR